MLRRGRFVLFIPCAMALLAARPAQRTPTEVTPQALATIWDAEHVSPPLPPLLDYSEVQRRLQAISRKNPDLFHVESVGRSVEGRDIELVTIGQGSRRILLWSQMHGDEPTATAALFDIFEYLDRHHTDENVRRLLSELTLYVIPMLNPDGAERFQRRNAQGIDINRDALRLQTPEGRALKAVRDRFNPSVGFNLHNENWRTSVGDPPKPASISLLSVAFNKDKDENAGRRLTRKICAVIRDALEPFASGQIGRYDDDFEVRAFGDNLTLWGTPVVLIETGPYPSADPDPPLVRMNFIGILSALDALATGRVDKADASRYESLPVNQSRMLTALVRNATVVNGAGVPPFTADIGINVNRRVRLVDGKRTLVPIATIDDLGDLRTSGALRTIDATGLIVAPLYDAALREGQEITLPDWASAMRPAGPVVAPGQPGALLLLRQIDGGRYRVQTVLTFEER
jgi:hypothetical protein